ncbi:MAG: hypothetical protein AAB686_02440 [Patescibacteria group bacterium]
MKHLMPVLLAFGLILSLSAPLAAQCMDVSNGSFIVALSGSVDGQAKGLEIGGLLKVKDGAVSGDVEVAGEGARTVAGTVSASKCKGDLVLEITGRKYTLKVFIGADSAVLVGRDDYRPVGGTLKR